MKWVLLVENYDSTKPPWAGENACDPLEVVYSLCKIDDDGNIIERDGQLSRMDHGWFHRLKEAMENGIYEKREFVPQKSAKYRAVRPD